MFHHFWGLNMVEATDFAFGVLRPTGFIPSSARWLRQEVGKVLGRKGETVRVIERDSGAKVELNKAEGKVEIFGHLEQIGKGWWMDLGDLPSVELT